MGGRGGGGESVKAMGDFVRMVIGEGGANNCLMIREY